MSTLVVTGTFVIISNACLCWYFSREIHRLEKAHRNSTRAVLLACRDIKSDVYELTVTVEGVQHAIQNDTVSEAADDSDWWKSA